MPKRIKIPPENQFQNDCGICMSTVEALSKSVKRITEPPRAMQIVYARRHPPPLATEPPTITGKSGSTHGASTVSTPAMKEIRKSIT